MLKDAPAVDPNVAHMFTACGIHELGQRIVAGADINLRKIDGGEISEFPGSDRSKLVVESERACAVDRRHFEGLPGR